MIYGFGFGGEKPTPSRSRANNIAEAVCALLEAKAALDRATEQVPRYTAQWDASDYYANELEAYYRASDDLEDAIDSERA